MRALGIIIPGTETGWSPARDNFQWTLSRRPKASAAHDAGMSCSTSSLCTAAVADGLGKG